jgi:nucleoside-diphosphate-sugar epimerase
MPQPYEIAYITEAITLKILVTGSSGRIGRYIVEDLLAAGHDVLGVDVRPPETRSKNFLRVDLTISGEAYQAVAGMDAVIHMGSWADPGVIPNTRTYGDNVQGAYNLLQACADLGVKRVVMASSGQVYGFEKHTPQYLPVDENHPLNPINCYALSKTAGEQMADYFVANYGMTVLSFRLNGVRPPEAMAADLERIQSEPKKAQGQLWMRTDSRDAATACRLAVEQPDVPSGAYNITGWLTLDEAPEVFVKRHFGDAVEIRGDLSALLSCAKAEAAFGYRPNYRWAGGQAAPITS